MGRAYQDLGEYTKAEKMHRAALALNRQVFGPESREAAASLNDLGDALSNEGQWVEAESAFQQALRIRRKAFGEVHPGCGDVAQQPGRHVSEPGERAGSRGA